MVNALTTPADITVGSPARPRSILAVASPAPADWELGGIQTSVTCPSPVVRDKCITLAGGDTAGRPTVETFPAFMIEQGSGCSTLSGERRAQEARDALVASTDYALGVTLLTGEANGAPSLADATNLGDFAYAVDAVAVLEGAAARAKGGDYVLHATPTAAVYLQAAGLIDDAGRSPSGAPWIVSTGYEPDEGDEPRQIWATGRVWAGVGPIDVHEAVQRRMNDREAWAVRSVIVGFNTCINLTATFSAADPEGA